MVVKKQENTTTKQLATWEIHANKLQGKLGHSIEDMMRATAEHLHYSVKVKLDVYEDYSMA